MRCTLRDWGHVWHLASPLEAKNCPGTVVAYVPALQPILARLLRDRANLSALRTFLSSGFAPGARAPVLDERQLIQELASRLTRGSCVLLQGDNKQARAHVPAKDPTQYTTWHLVPLQSGSGDEAAEGAPADGEQVPGLRVLDLCEEPAPIRFATGPDRQPGLMFGNAAGGESPVRFLQEAEGPRSFGNSASVTAPA